MYKQLKTPEGQIADAVFCLTNGACIPFDPANVDYQQFKKAINDDTAQLEDAEGNLMTAEEAKAFVKELP